MNVGSKDQNSVTLNPSILTMKQRLDMTVFHITDYVLGDANIVKGGIKMTIRMERKILSEIMTTYFPSLLLMMITYATTFFKPFLLRACVFLSRHHTFPRQLLELEHAQSHTEQVQSTG